MFKSWLLLERLRRQAAKPRLALKRLAAELKCTENSAIFYLLTKYCLPFFHYHPQDGLVYHVTWKHHVLYAPIYFRVIQYIVFSVFVCNWKDSGGIQIYRQSFAIFFSSFGVLFFVVLHTIFWRRRESQSLFNVVVDYDKRLKGLESTGLKACSFFKPPQRAIRKLQMFAAFMAVLVTVSAPCQILITILDPRTALSPFDSQLGKENPKRGWWILAESALGGPTVVFVELTMSQLAVPWLLFSVGFRTLLTRISALLSSDQKPSFEKMDLLANHYVALWRILTVFNETMNPCFIAVWRTAIVASLVPANLLLYRWYLGSSEVRDVNPLVIIFLAVMWILMLAFGLWSFNYMGSFRIQSNEIMKAMNYYCLQRLIESDCDPEVRNQVAYLRRRIRSLREICVESSTFGKISAMADIRILEELTDYTTSGLLTTG